MPISRSGTERAVTARSGASLLPILILIIALLGVILVRSTSAVSGPSDVGVGAAASIPADVATRAPASADAIVVMAVENAHEAVVKHLASTGIDCFTEAAVAVGRVSEEAQALDDRIESARVPQEAWILDQAVWLGSRERAAGAFSASAAFRDAGSTWIVIDSKDGPVGYELAETRTKLGRATWSLRDRVAGCVSEDPYYDEEIPPVYPSE